ncbi:MAG: MaoC/PaaZ C-terminal domain-containing protein [Solirubrobacteraceae bacterium]
MATREVQVGQQLEPFVIESVDPEPMKTMAAILQDPNPIHFDPASTHALGMGDKTVNQGPTNVTWLTEFVQRFAGGPGRLVTIKIRFLGNVFSGDRFECTGTVTAVDAEAGTAELEVGATSDGRPALGGTAVIKIRD